MKNKFISIIVSLGLGLGLFTGCATKPSVDPDRQAKLERTAVILENITYSALLIVADKQPEDLNKIVEYANLGIVTVRTLISSEAVTPEDLQKALEAIPVKEFKSIEAKLIVPTVVSAYSIWLGESVKNWYDSEKNFVAKTLLTGILRGAEQAVKVLKPEELAARAARLNQVK